MSKSNLPVFNRNDLKREIKNRLEDNGRNLYQKDIDFIIDNVFDIIEEEVCRGCKVKITSFGSFYAREVKRHYGRDVRNPKMVTIVPAHKRITFSSGKTFKDKVNKERR